MAHEPSAGIFKHAQGGKRHITASSFLPTFSALRDFARAISSEWFGSGSEKLRIVERVRLSVFGYYASYLRLRVELNRIFLPVVAVIVLSFIEGKVRFPVDLRSTLIGKDDDTMDVVDDPVAEVKGQFTDVESTCQEECDLVVERAPVQPG